jgi:type IV pilus assembly protein PilB
MRPVVRLVDLIVLEALRSGSQQVHIDTGTLLVRFLHTGEWHPVMKVPAAALQPVVNRLRVMAALDRTKGNTRQEGGFEVVAEDAPVAIRVVVQFTDAGDEEVYLHLPSAEQQ